jgi:hypothetical protein
MVQGSLVIYLTVFVYTLTKSILYYTLKKEFKIKETWYPESNIMLQTYYLIVIYKPKIYAKYIFETARKISMSQCLNWVKALRHLPPLTFALIISDCAIAFATIYFLKVPIVSIRYVREISRCFPTPQIDEYSIIL